MQVRKPHIFKIDGNKLGGTNTSFQQFFFNQFQHDRLPAAADTGHHFDKVPSNKWADAAHIAFSFYHKGNASFSPMLIVYTGYNLKST